MNSGFQPLAAVLVAYLAHAGLAAAPTGSETGVDPSNLLVGDVAVPAAATFRQGGRTPEKKWVPEQGHYEDVYETVHVPAVTHEEPVYTTVVDQEAYTTYTRVYYTRDGWSGTDRDEARQHHISAGGHTWWEDIPEKHPAVTHQEQTGTTTVVDTPAHDERRKTGTKWVVDVPGHWE